MGQTIRQHQQTSSSWAPAPTTPQLGRFFAVDPIDGGSLNNYDYAGQDPINGYDLSGQRPDGLGGTTLRKGHEAAVATFQAELGAALVQLYENGGDQGVIGFCAGFSIGVPGVGGFGEACYTVNMQGHAGLTLTAGAGPGSSWGALASGSIGGLTSNAKCAKQLGGPFHYVSVAGAGGPGGVAASTAWDEHGTQTGFAGYSWGAGLSVSSGVSWTFVIGGGGC